MISPDYASLLLAYSTPIGFGLLALYTLWTLAFLARDVIRHIRNKTPDDIPLWRRLCLRLLTYTLVVLVGLRVARLVHNPLQVPGVLPAAAWFLIAILIALPLKGIIKKSIATLPALLIADTGLVLVLYFAMVKLSYLPRIPNLVFCGLYLHFGLLALPELWRLQGFRRTMAALTIFILLNAPIMIHRSLADVEDLHRPGVASRVPGTEGKIYSVAVDRKSGVVFYLDRQSPSRIHGVNPQTGKRYIFGDPRERFAKLIPGAVDGTLLAASDNPEGRSVMLLSVPEFSVMADFAVLKVGTRGFRAGPPAVDADMTNEDFVASVRYKGGAGLALCGMPLDGSEPKGNMGRACHLHSLPWRTPGAIFLDSEKGLIYVADMGSAPGIGGGVRQLTTRTLSLRNEFAPPKRISAIAMSRDRRALYLGYAWDKTIHFMIADSLKKTYKVGIHIFPTCMVVDSGKRNLYIGSWFDGSVQVLRLHDGWPTRPIPTGPGIRDLALDEKRNLLYAATDAGVIKINLALVPMPTGARIIEPSGPR